MDENQIKEKYEEFQGEFPGMDTLLIMDKDAKILYCSDPEFANEEDTKNLLDVWKNKKSPLKLGGKRYVVLKWDDIQFASKNVVDKNAIIGSITKSGNYVVVLYQGTGNLLQSTIDLNRWCWNLI